MDSLTLVLAAYDAAFLLQVLTVVLGLGLVIVFHELGHFAVAKWCDVQVDCFSIGFGPVLFGRKWGETEYTLRAIPFGGYVKMLGQDDVDPSQLTSEEIAENPRSYTAKSVPQRMAIISAGVIMNIVTGLMFFIIGFRGGVQQFDRELGAVIAGAPAWENGIRPDDTLTSINGAKINGFNDLMRGIVLSNGPVNIAGTHADGTPFSVTLEPTRPESGKNTRRTIGVVPAQNLTIRAAGEGSQEAAVVPGSPLESVKSQLQAGDVILSVSGTPVKRFADVESLFADHSGETVQLALQRRDERGKKLDQPVIVDVPPQAYRTLGLQMDIGKITDVRPGSPAEAVGLKKGDKLVKIDGQAIGADLDPLRLPELFRTKIGQPVSLQISREDAGGEPKSLDFTVTPEATPGWVEHPLLPNTPLSVTSVGFAYHLIPTVFQVEPGSPAAKQGIVVRDMVTKMELVLRQDLPKPYDDAQPISIEIGDDNWAYADWLIQQSPVASVKVTLKGGTNGQPETKELVPVTVTDKFVQSDRGLMTEQKTSVLKANNVSEAVALGWRHTADSTKDIYLTLRGLFSRTISVKELQGPINIARIAYHSAGKGLSDFVVFLGLISINLAVINFLPIPVLDGGHMVFLLWEGLVRRRPNERVVAAATYCGLFFVLGLMMFVIYQDIFGH